MTRANPTHPGESLLIDCIEALNLTVAEVAAHMRVPEAELAAVCECRAPITADLAVRIDMAFGGTAETWLAMQSAHDLAKARRSCSSLQVPRIEQAA